MIEFTKKIYRKIKGKYHYYRAVNWIKTYYFNYKKFPNSIAKKLPVFIYGKLKLSSIEGEFIIDAPISKGMIGFGKSFEFPTTSKGVSELSLNGTFICKGNVQIGKDVCIQIAKNAYFEMGHFSCLGSDIKVICKEKIVIKNFVRIGYQTQLIDTTIHQMIDTKGNTKLPMTAPIVLNSNTWIGNRTTIMKGTVTPEQCIVASNSLCNKDYTAYGNNILIGGMPAKLLKEGIVRDWKGEQAMLEKSVVIA
ncbi:acyltransferase [Aequorivita soesokkakensis]|jgi:acetyltransferase-like isoleucine patch superfamily enzyme|uniref:acyltransferase n=1 Tax=Aequorivita soesokkakensis TaxID=1385699 RepID=UPI001F60F15B|nr:transferase [Aequorivita soesokkakensis]